MLNKSEIETSEFIVSNFISYFVMNLDLETQNFVLTSLLESFNGSKNNEKVDNKDFGIDNSGALINAISCFLINFKLKADKQTEVLIKGLNHINYKILKNIGSDSKLIKKRITEFYNGYKYTYDFFKTTLSEESNDIIKDLSKSHSYFS